MAKNRPCLGIVLVLASFALSAALPSYAQTALEGKNFGALAQSNLKKPRPAAPDDLTGTYNFGFGPENGGNPMTAYLFTPGPKLTPAAQAQVDKHAYWLTKGFEYRDDPAACWPLGMPRIMTRYWPIQIVRLPTMTMIVSMFENNVRWVYTDGRTHPSDDDIVYTYNGHSIGHWEGKTFVVDTVGMTDDRPGQLGGGVEDDQAICPRRSCRHRGAQMHLRGGFEISHV